MKIKKGFVKFAALSLAAGAVTVGGLGFAGTASADGGPQGNGNRGLPNAGGAGFGPRQGAGVAVAGATIEQPAGFRADLLAAASQKLGVSRAQLQQELQGKSLGQVSVSHGVTAADLKTTLVDAENAALQKATAAGTVTQAQANQQVSLIPGMVQRFLDRGASTARPLAGAQAGPTGQGGPGGPQAGRPAGGQPGGPNAQGPANGGRRMGPRP